MKTINILWADDEIELLKPHIIFLQERGFNVDTATNGEDALKKVIANKYSIIFVDENMPGLSGLETIDKIKFIYPNLPVVMITKSEEENIMDQAIGSKIADYLIKPVNPNQVLLSLKKNIDNKRLVEEKTTASYQAEFGKLSMDIIAAKDHNDWVDIYKRIVFWDIETEVSTDESIKEIIKMQKAEANSGFSKFIQSHYKNWFQSGDHEKPVLSPSVFRQYVFPALKKKQKVFFILIDNLRFDQWKILYPEIRDYLVIEDESLYYSILPTATQYSRNAIFAGLMPFEIEKYHKDLWIEETEEESKNLFEEELLHSQMNRLGEKIKFAYKKIGNKKAGKKVIDNFNNLLNNDLNVLIYNFVDMLSHARTEMKMIRELTDDDSAYRSLTLSWFQHSFLFDLIKLLSEQDVKVIITTDHGSIRVNNPIKVVGDKQTSTNLRYKQGKSLNYNRKEVFEIIEPQEVRLPKRNVSTRYIFAVNDDFLAYPNNYNYYVNYYKNTFQHGGVSMEEMLIPLVTLAPNNNT